MAVLLDAADKHGLRVLVGLWLRPGRPGMENDDAFDYVRDVRPFVRRSHNPYVLETAAAAQFGLKQCTAALAEQQKAVELLPAEWPAPERERFQRKLQDYQSACDAPKAVSAATGPR